jgi:predicted GIY-YIG superfamily endonuclease
MAFYVYRHFDADSNLLYVGMSASPIARYFTHKCSSNWRDRISRIEISAYPIKALALEDESKAMRDENPLFNKQKRIKKLFLSDIVEPNWPLIISDIIAASYTEKQIAEVAKVSQPTIHKLKSGQQKSAKHAVGELLLKLHRKVKRA